MNKIYERMKDFDVVELCDILEIEPEEIIERFSERINEDQVPWVFDEGY